MAKTDSFQACSVHQQLEVVKPRMLRYFRYFIAILFEL